MTHDPLCPNAEGDCCPWMGECDCQCLCEWIAKIRTDEGIAFNRKIAIRRVEEKVEAYAKGITEGRRRSSKESRRTHKDAYQRGRKDGIEQMRTACIATIENWSSGTHDSESCGCEHCQTINELIAKAVAAIEEVQP